jgi:hypothetical protein
MIKFLIVILFLGFYSNSFSQLSDEDLLWSIRHDEVDVIENYFLNKNDPNRLFGKDKVPLLHYAATIDKAKAIETILNAGANIEKLYFNETPLMVASWYGNQEAANLLIMKGAHVNFRNNKGKTAAIYAAQTNKPAILKLLFESGADLCMKDCTENGPIDYAYKFQNIESYNYLAEIVNNSYDKKLLPDYFDGPYLFWESKSKLRIRYLINDSAKNVCYESDSLINLNKQTLVLNKKGQAFEIPIIIIAKKDKNEDTYSGIKKIMAIGDLHGEFEVFAKFLINNKIIDTSFNWTFGDGHLLLMGDIFDRGNHVTECLWLLYKLEKEAELQNGKVHVLLGNHEIMEISGDKRYLSEKYIDLFNRLRLNYTSFYNKETEIGKWLRTKNTILQINDILFVHGGISPEVVQKRLSISFINKKIKEILNKEQHEPVGEIEEFLTGTNGPLWYRGYLKLDNKYYQATGDKFDFDEKKLRDILNFYKIKTIVFANTNVKKLTPIYNNQLIGIDISFTEPDVELQGLYYDGKDFYTAHADGHIELLK